MKIGIIGAGYAGVSAALEAVRKEAEVTLFSNEEFLPYYRPRIIGVAFGQTKAEDIFMHPAEWYSANNINLLTDSEVTALKPYEKNVLLYSKNKEYIFDKIVICSGAVPNIPFFASNISADKLFTIWTLRNALNLKQRLNTVKSISIIGGGLIGLETALRAADIGIKVTILEKADRLLENNFSAKGSEAIRRLFHRKGIDVILNSSIQKITTSADSITITTQFNSVTSDIAILSAGCRPKTTLVSDANIKYNNGILVDEMFVTSSKNIYASGDAAEFSSSRTLFSVQRALAQGKVSGINASSSADSKPIKYVPTELSLDLKYKDFEIHSIGRIRKHETCSCESSVLEDDDAVYRAIMKDSNIVYGIEMVGTSKQFDHYKKLLKQ